MAMAVTRSKSSSHATALLKPATRKTTRNARPAAPSKPALKVKGSKTPPIDLPILYFETAKDLENSLDREYDTSTGFWLKLARSSLGVPCVNTAKAIEIALCFGWINGCGRGVDDNFYLARYTPR